MHRFTLKIVCFLCCLFIVWAVNDAQAAKSSDRHVSNRIKIERPEKPSPGPAEAPQEKAAEPDQRQAAPKKPEKSDVEEKKVEEEAEKIAKKPKAKEEKSGPEAMQEEAVSLMGDKETLYARKGKLDPFAPFIQGTEPESGGEAEEELQRRKPRTPLERLSLGQLRLTAVMETPGKRLALVEESSGKGYVVKKGTYIGDQGGRITRVLSEAIVIEEKYRDAFGNVDTREKKLKLQK